MLKLAYNIAFGFIAALIAGYIGLEGFSWQWWVFMGTVIGGNFLGYIEAHLSRG